MTKSLEQEYTEFLLDLCETTYRETGKAYNPTRFRRMVQEHGGVEATRRILWHDKYSTGFTRLWELRQLKLSVEAQLLEDEKWHPLFEQRDIERCREILEQYGYFG